MFRHKRWSKTIVQTLSRKVWTVANPATISDLFFSSMAIVLSKALPNSRVAKPCRWECEAKRTAVRFQWLRRVPFHRAHRSSIDRLPCRLQESLRRLVKATVPKQQESTPLSARTTRRPERFESRLLSNVRTRKMGQQLRTEFDLLSWFPVVPALDLLKMLLRLQIRNFTT